MNKIDEFREGFMDAVMLFFRFIHEGIQEVFIPVLEQLSRHLIHPTFRKNDGRKPPNKGKSHEQ